MIQYLKYALTLKKLVSYPAFSFYLNAEIEFFPSFDLEEM